MHKHRMLLSLVMAGVLLFVVGSAKADDKVPYPLGEVTIEATQVATGLGYSWGDGTPEVRG